MRCASSRAARPAGSNSETALLISAIGLPGSKPSRSRPIEPSGARRKENSVSETIDTLNPQKPKRVAIVASNPAVSKQTGWPIGFWWSELTHPYWAFTEHGYSVDLFSPDGGRLEADNWSDPRDESKYSEHDLISLGFICSPQHA